MKRKGYEPPKRGDICYVRSSSGAWSAGSVVEILDPEMPMEMASVRHLATNEIFTVFIDNLVRKRNRS